jgi:hypothetical protein
MHRRHRGRLAVHWERYGTECRIALPDTKRRGECVPQNQEPAYGHRDCPLVTLSRELRSSRAGYQSGNLTKDNLPDHTIRSTPNRFRS